MVDRTRRVVLSMDGQCESCAAQSRGKKSAMRWAASHTRRTGHLTWVTVDYGYSRTQAATQKEAE